MHMGRPLTLKGKTEMGTARRTVSIAATAFTLATLALGIWVISPRFAITGPSLIDDWNALVGSPARLHALVRLHNLVDNRFYPAWDLWNWIQWRVPGAPGNMLGPNLLGVARLALLVLGMTALAWVIVPLARMHPLERALLCSLPALVVITVPAFAVDLARFGPQEIALAGGMMLGGSLLYVGGRDLAADSVRAPIRAWICLSVGFLVWCFGVLSKETSVCVLLALPFAIVRGPAVVQRLGRRQRRIAAGVVAAALLPVFLMLYEVARIVQRGSLQYGARVQTGGGAVSEFVHALHVMPQQMMSILGVALLVGLVAAVVLGLFRRTRRLDWFALPILVVALAALEMSVQSGFFESRYYLPSIALLAVGAARAAAWLPTRYLRFVLLAGCVFALFSATKAHGEVERWAADDEQGNAIVSAVRAATRGGCGLSFLGIDEERMQSITALVQYGLGNVDCQGAPRQVLLDSTMNQTPEAACAPSLPTIVGTWPYLGSHEVVLVRC